MFSSQEHGTVRSLGGTQVLNGYLLPNGHAQLCKIFLITFVGNLGGQPGLVVKRPPGNQEVGGSNPTKAM